MSNLRKAAAGVGISVLAFVITSPYYVPGLVAGTRGYGTWKSTDVLTIATNWEASGGLLGNILNLPGRLLGILIPQLGLPQILLAVVGLIVVIALIQRRRELLPYLSVLAVFVVMLMFVSPYYVERTRILPLYAFVTLAAAVGLSRLQATLLRIPGASVALLVIVFAWQALLAGSVMAAYRAPDVQAVSDQWMLQNVDPQSTIGLQRGPVWRYPNRLSYDASLLDGAHPRESRQTDYRLEVSWDLDSLVTARPDWIILYAPWLAAFQDVDRDSSYVLVKEFRLDVPRVKSPLSLLWNPFILYETHLYFLRRRSQLG